MIKYTNWFLALALSACTVGAMIPAAMADTAGGNVEAEAVSTSSLPIENRIKAYNELVRKINVDKNADKNIILDKGLELLASPDLKDANQQKQVRRTVLDNARKYNQNVLEKLSREIVADVNAGMDLRIAANRDLINIEFNRNNIDAAKKAAESAIAWANQTPDNIAENYKNYGDLLFMNNECDAAVKIYRKMGEQNPKSTKVQNDVVSKITAAYIANLRYEDAEKVFVETQNYSRAADMWKNIGFKEKAQKYAIKILENKEKSISERRNAWFYFTGATDAERQIRKKYTREVFVPGENIPYSFERIAWQLMYDGNYTDVMDIFDIINASSNKEKDKFKIVSWQLTALAARGEFDKAKALAEKYSNFEGWSAKERYQTLMNKVLFAEKDGNFEKAWKKADAAFTEKITVKEKIDALTYVGRNALSANKNKSVLQIEKITSEFYVPEPRKTLTVKYSPKRINSIEDFPALDPKTAQQLDRKFGGNMDFLVTDVATGDRGAGIADGKKETYKPTIFNVCYDDVGVHFLFRAYDDRAREVEAKLLGAGSYEIYLAPGINQPYFCFLPNLQTGSCGIFHTTYETEEHQRVSIENGGYRQTHRFLDDGYLTHIVLDWKYFFNKLPDTGDVWEFENVHWGRNGGFGWNGTKTIHGRSTWGHLVFQMEPEALIKIKRRIVFDALQNFKKEQVTNATIHGIISLMQDNVLGDPEFFKAKVQPLLKELQQYEALVKYDMSDADVENVFKNAVPYWNKIDYKILEMRRKYLEEKISNQD